MWWKILLTTLTLVLITAPVYSEDKPEFIQNSKSTCPLDMRYQTESLGVCEGWTPVGFLFQERPDGALIISFIQTVEGARYQVFITDDTTRSSWFRFMNGHGVGDRVQFIDYEPRPERIYYLETREWSRVKIEINPDDIHVLPTATPTPTNTPTPTATPQPTVTPTPPAYPAPAALIFLPLLIR